MYQGYISSSSENKILIRVKIVLGTILKLTPASDQTKHKKWLDRRSASSPRLTPKSHLGGPTRARLRTANEVRVQSVTTVFASRPGGVARARTPIDVNTEDSRTTPNHDIDTTKQQRANGGSTQLRLNRLGARNTEFAAPFHPPERSTNPSNTKRTGPHVKEGEGAVAPLARVTPQCSRKINQLKLYD